jgi:hypothetical protein
MPEMSCAFVVKTNNGTKIKTRKYWIQEMYLEQALPKE